MFDRIDVSLGAMMDAEKSLNDRAQGLEDRASDLADGIAALRATTSGEASDAAVRELQRARQTTLTYAQSLRSNATALESIASVYDQADLSGARAFGES